MTLTVTVVRWRPRLASVDVRLDLATEDLALTRCTRPMWSEFDGTVEGPADWRFDSWPS